MLTWPEKEMGARQYSGLCNKLDLTGRMVRINKGDWYSSDIRHYPNGKEVSLKGLEAKWST